MVDDYPAFLEMMDAMLGSVGHEVFGFDGQAASIREISDTRPDLMIIDVAVKEEGTTGWDILALVRVDPTLREVPVVVCTADVIQTRERQEELTRLGNIRVLEKPFSAEELDAVVRPDARRKGTAGELAGQGGPGSPQDVQELRAEHAIVLEGVQEGIAPRQRRVLEPVARRRVVSIHARDVRHPRLRRHHDAPDRVSIPGLSIHAQSS